MHPQRQPPSLQVLGGLGPIKESDPWTGKDCRVPEKVQFLDTSKPSGEQSNEVNTNTCLHISHQLLRML